MPHPPDNDKPESEASQHVPGQLAPYGSDEHVAWILRRQRRNQEFREQVAAAARLALYMYDAARRQRLAS